MLLLALAISSAAIAPDQKRTRRAPVVRVQRRDSVVSKRIRSACGASCAPARPSPYRLPLPSSEVVDGKDLAVRQTGIPCGTVGAPVCPSNGTTLLKTTP